MDVHPTKNGINRYWSIPISKRFPYSPSDRVQELYPSWARPWARLGVAAEGMEEPRSCDIDGSRHKICGFCLGYHVVQHSDQFCPTAIVMIETCHDMPNWSSNSEDKPLVVQTWHITSKLSYLVIHPRHKGRTPSDTHSHFTQDSKAAFQAYRRAVESGSPEKQQKNSECWTSMVKQTKNHHWATILGTKSLLKIVENSRGTCSKNKGP